MDSIAVNDRIYRVLSLLGKGKGGYSYLVTDGENEYVLKQIHHEPCSYYTFGDKLGSELRDYSRLREIGIPIPKLLDYDTANERILKEYIRGDTIDHLILRGEMRPEYLAQMQNSAPFSTPQASTSTTTRRISSFKTKRFTISTTSATNTAKSGIFHTGVFGTGRKHRNFALHL